MNYQETQPDGKTSMKVVQINKYGSNDVVEIIKNLPKPTLIPSKVLVEIHSAGVNPVDWKIREGYLQQMAPLHFPATLGGDFSGVIKEIGAEVSNLKKGDEVYGQAGLLSGGSGAFAEYAIADPKNIARKPKTVSHAEAAALPLAGVSAVQALIEHMNLSSGQKILIHGGAGGIGTFAIQLAKHLGAHVATTVRADEMDHARKIRADEIIDYEKQSFENQLQNFDAVYDTVGGDTYVRSYKVLKPNGVIVSMLEQPKEELTKKYGVRAVGQFTGVNNARLSKLAEFVDKRAIKVFIDKIYPLEQTREALAYLQKGFPRGKVVLK